LYFPAPFGKITHIFPGPTLAVKVFKSLTAAACSGYGWRMTNKPTASPYDATPIATKVLGREPLRPPLPKKFYTTVTVAMDGAQHAIQLDGRGVRTPKKRKLALPTGSLAEAIAAEWRAQSVLIDPVTMPLTKISNSVIDGIIGNEGETADEITRFSGSDLLCYRVETPVALAHRQAQIWPAIVQRLERRLGATFVPTTGLMPVTQPPETLAAVAQRLRACDAYQLAAAHIITTLTGSAILALARLDGDISAVDVWGAAHIDEDYQIELWGPDDEAAGRRAFRWNEMQAADRLLGLV
jgi:chaperone required for assembly of F1-ATPase